jgi:hypothetical protein
MMKRITRNAIIMICPFRLAFFMTIATLFCIQTKGEVSDCSNWYKVNGNWVKHIPPTLWSLTYTTLANMQFHVMHAELFRKWGGMHEEGSWRNVLRWSRRYKAHLHKVKPIWSSFHIEVQLTQKLLLNNGKQNVNIGMRKGLKVWLQIQ